MQGTWIKDPTYCIVTDNPTSWTILYWCHSKLLLLDQRYEKWAAALHETRRLHQNVVFFDWKVLQGPARPSGPLPLTASSWVPGTYPSWEHPGQDGSFQSLTLRVTITHVLQLISGSILKRFLDYKSLNVPGSPAVKTHPFNAGGFNPWGTEIPHASQGKKNLNRKKSLSIWTSQLKGFLTGVKTTVNPISLYWAQRFSTNTFQYS